MNFNINEIISLRTFLLATIFDYYHASDMEAITGYEVTHVLDIVTKIEKLIHMHSNDIDHVFSAEELSIIANCLMYGYFGINVYGKYKKIIDYKGYDFSVSAEKLMSIWRNS